MFKTPLLLLFFLIASVHVSTSQSVEHMRDINQVWAKFYQAFETLDHEPMAEIHSKDLVRISGGRNIIDYDTYINNYRNQFKALRETKSTRHIALRFFERIQNDSVASERGIYKLIVNKGIPEEQAYYGQFHVLLKKDNGVWKITMDYDSNEGNTIGEEQFQNAHAIDDFDAFVNH